MATPQSGAAELAPEEPPRATIAAGARTVILIVAEVPAAGQERNGASVTTAGRDPRPDNNLSHFATKARPILLLRKTASVRSVLAGHDVRYRLAVSNPTSIAVGHVTVCDSLPTKLVFVAAHPAAKLSVGRYCFAVPSLAAHGSRGFTVIANAAPRRRRAPAERSRRLLIDPAS